MQQPQVISIDTTQTFPHLSRAPIVEAVVDFRTRAEVPWRQQDVQESLNRQLPDYKKNELMFDFSVSFHVELNAQPDAQGASHTESSRRTQDWIGVKVETSDGINIGMFTRAGFTYSRLPPYEDWDRFSTEALRLWSVHHSMARSSDIQRLGVRFINRLEVPTENLDLSNYFQGFGTAPGRLPVAGFFYRDVLACPPSAYLINVIRTLRLPEAAPPTTVQLLLDIDVSSTEALVPDDARIKHRLGEMAWIKNRVFFDSLTEAALDLCR